MFMMNKSARMSAYNFAKWYGKRSGQFDSKRVDRALGLLVSGKFGAKQAEYSTSVNGCDCPDAQIRRVFCKHQIAAMILEKHDQLLAAA